MARVTWWYPIQPTDERHDVSEMQVAVRLDSLTQSERGAIFGEMAVQVGDKQFPDPDWNDFIVVVLGWWSETCTSLLAGSSHSEELWFMDGPFLLTIEVESSQVWSVNFMRQRAAAGPAMIKSEPVPGLPADLRIAALRFTRSVALRGREVLNACLQHGWMTPELDDLASRNRTLRSRLGI
jgi:hypothetical protein